MPDRTPGPKTERRIVGRAREVLDGDALVTPTLSADLDRLFDAHRPQLLALAKRIVKDQARAEELVQEALMTAYTKLPTYEGGARFKTWIYGITRNLCLNAVRKRSEVLSDDGVLEAGSAELDVLTALQREEREAFIAEATADLEPEEQEAIYLRYVECLPQDQITDILELSGSGARGLLQRCRRKLRRRLVEKLAEMGHGESFVRGE